MASTKDRLVKRAEKDFQKAEDSLTKASAKAETAATRLQNATQNDETARADLAKAQAAFATAKAQVDWARAMPVVEVSDADADEASDEGGEGDASFEGSLSAEVEQVEVDEDDEALVV